MSVIGLAAADAAAAALSIVASLLGAGESEDVAETLKKALAGLAEELARLAVDGGSDVKFLVHS